MSASCFGRAYFDMTDEHVDRDVIPLDDGRRADLSSFDDSDIGPSGAFVTRWGGDAIRKDPPRRHGRQDDAGAQPGFFIPLSAFRDLEAGEDNPHRPMKVDRASMPVPSGAPDEADPPNDLAGNENAKPSTSRSDFLPVSLLTYEPCFDLDLEQWYVDVDLAATRASEPIVRFGLVRYQEHAIGWELQVSYPVMVITPLLPDRLATVEVVRPADPGADLEVRVEAVGRGSRDIYDLPLDGIVTSRSQEDREAWLEAARKWSDGLRKPLLRFVLFHEHEEGGLMQRNRVLTSDSEVAVEFDREIVPEGSGLNLIWACDETLRIPRSRQLELGAGRYVCYIEEVDRRMPASYPTEPITPVAMFDPVQPVRFVDSGPRFSARIPFLELPSI